MHGIQCFQGEGIKTLYQASKYTIKTAVSEGSLINIVGFSSRIDILSEFVQVHLASRPTLVENLPLDGNGTHSMWLG